MRLMLIAFFLLGPALWAPPYASAQAPGRMGSRILSLGSWTYEAIERLRSRGYLPGLNPLAQPYRRIDVAAELIVVDADSLQEPTAGWVRMLRRELAPEFRRLSEDARRLQCCPQGHRLGAAQGERKQSRLLSTRT